MLSKEDAIAKLNEQIDKISEVKKHERFSPQFKKWKRDTEVAIENIFDRLLARLAGGGKREWVELEQPTQNR